VKSTDFFRLAVLSFLLLVACGREKEGDLPRPDRPSPPIAEDDVIARVGGRSLGLKEFQELIPEEYKGLLTPEEKRDLLDRWVNTELLYMGAESRGMLEDPELTRRLMKQRRDFFANAYLQKAIDERVGISESELSDYYSEHRDEYSWEYRYRQIVVNSSEEAWEIRGKLRNGKISFKRAAEKYSLDVSARLGGDMGWMSRTALAPEILSRLLNMEKGDISDPFETTWGWTLVQFRDRRESKNALELSALREEILRRLLAEKRSRVYGEILDELRKAFPVEYDPELDERLGGNPPPRATP